MANSKLKRLIEKRDAVNARIKQEQNKLRSNERKSDTRRKILAGAAVLQWAARDEAFAKLLMAELENSWCGRTTEPYSIFGLAKRARLKPSKRHPKQPRGRLGFLRKGWLLRLRRLVRVCD